MLLVIIIQQLIQAGSFYDGHILRGICSLLHGDLALFPGGPGKNDRDIGRIDIITFTMVTTNRAETVPEDLFSLAKTETRLSHGRVLIRRWILMIIYTDGDIY